MLDITNWKVDNELNASGTREKFWVIHPETGERYLFKLPKENTGEIWAEKIASEIGKHLGLYMMDVSIAFFGNRNGLLLRNFTEYGVEEFYDGGDLIKAIIEDFDPYTLNDYSLLNICKAIEPFQFEKEVAQMIMFDALIGNQDRHCENWGIIIGRNGERFAPIFDNGASLGFNNSEDRVKLMFKDKKMFDAFINKGKSLISVEGIRKPKVGQLLEALNNMYPDLVNMEIKRLNSLQMSSIKHILNEIPESIMSNTYKNWVEQLLSQKIQWINSWYKGETNHD